MQVGDLVMENPDQGLGDALNLDSGDTLGIIIDVEDGIATVSWFWHGIFGAHECYSTRQELIILNKKLDKLLLPR